MIRTHGRYPYSSITTRPVYDWPNGTRLAVYVAVNIEQFSFGEGKGAAIAPPDQGEQPQRLLVARLRQSGRHLAPARADTAAARARRLSVSVRD